MKKLIYILLFISLLSRAQSSVQKSIESNAKTILITLDQADAITVFHSKGNEIIVKMLRYPESKYTLQLEEIGNEIQITSKIIVVENTVEVDKICKEQPFYPGFEIWLPKQKNIYINYKKGNFYTSNFQGNITLEAENSNIHIKGFKGNINLTVLAGFVECALSNSKINVKSSKAIITTDFDTIQSFSKTLETTYQKQLNSIKVKTIYANVLLKTFKTQ